MQHSIHHINNIPVVLSKTPDAHSTTVEILAKAGSIYETKETNGISHFLEHMFFKGGKKYTTPKAVASTIDSFGGEFNAFTGSEYAGYYVKSWPEHVETSLDVLSDMLLHARFPKPEMEQEKQVVTQEIKMYEDMPQQTAYHNWKRRYYGNNSFGWKTLGTIDNVQSFSQQDLIDHKNSCYTRDNLVISVAGAIPDEGKLLEMIELYFGELPAKKQISPPDFPILRPDDNQHHNSQDTQQNHLVIGAPGISLHDDQKYACKLLAVILGGTMSSRLFQEIREKQGLCYYIKATHMSNDNDGLFLMRAGIEKERREQGLEAIYDQLEQIANGNVSQEEYKNALGNAKGKTQIWLESTNELAHFHALQQLFTDQILTVDEIINKYEQVSLQAINDSATLLTDTNLYAYRLE